MTGFNITVKNGLIDAKHFRKMGGDRDMGTIWLFLWLLDKVTNVNQETKEGKVLGGKPIKYEEVNKDLPISRRTYLRWIHMLRNEGYIKTIRTPYGLIITVFKSVKIFQKRCVIEVTSSTPSDVSDKAHLDTFGGTSNKDNTIRQYNSTNTFSYKKVFNDKDWARELLKWKKGGGKVIRSKKLVLKNNKKLLLDQNGKWEELKQYGEPRNY